MDFYAYLPDKDGKEPLGSANRIISRGDYKSLTTFVRYRLKPFVRNYQKYRIFTFTNFYDEKTFKQVK